MRGQILANHKGVRSRATWFQLALATAIAAAAISGLAIGAGGAGANPPDCSSGGTCVVGDVGPGGGIVFFAKSTGAFNVGRTFTSNDFMCVYMHLCNTVSVSLTADQQAALP